jgi:hypothetical protein
MVTDLNFQHLKADAICRAMTPITAAMTHTIKWDAAIYFIHCMCSGRICQGARVYVCVSALGLIGLIGHYHRLKWQIMKKCV